MKTINADLTRGFDVMRGNKVLAHYKTYAEALAASKQADRLVIRYWGQKPAES